MDVYTEVYTTIDDDEVWSAVADEVEAAIRTETDAAIEAHCNEHHDGTTTSGDDISEAVRAALVTLLTNLLTPPFVDPYERPALGNDPTPSEGDPTT